jgi:predicted nucleic acid-binding protein
MSQHLRAVQRMQSDAMITIAPQGHESFLAGSRLYEACSDKGYSLTDCISKVVMGREGVSEVLSNDQHFTQEGFSRLLGD